MTGLSPAVALLVIGLLVGWSAHDAWLSRIHRRAYQAAVSRGDAWCAVCKLPMPVLEAVAHSHGFIITRPLLTREQAERIRDGKDTP